MKKSIFGILLFTTLSMSSMAIWANPGNGNNGNNGNNGSSANAGASADATAVGVGVGIAGASSSVNNKTDVDVTTINTIKNSNSQGQGQQQGQGQSQSTANSNNSSVTVQGDNFEAAKIPASTAVAPTMFSTAMCQAARAGAFQSRIFGISIGGTIIDDNCISLEQFRVISTVVKDKETINAMACLASPIYRQARKDIGAMCPIDQAASSNPSKAFGQP